MLLMIQSMAMSCVDCVLAGICCQEMPQICNDSGRQYVSYGSCVLVSMDYDVSANGDNCTSETLLSEPLCAVMDDVAYREQIEALSGYFDPQDCEEWCDGDVPDAVERYCDTIRPDVAKGGVVFQGPAVTSERAQKLL